MTRIKICGLTRPEDIRVINEVEADYCGFIVEYPKSSRCVSVAQVRELSQLVQGKTIPVGVFVNAPPELPAMLANEGTIGSIQLHGQEDVQYIRELRKHTRAKLIQAFSIRTEADAARALESEADYILLDQGKGGTGKSFDWSLLPKIERPFFLAGGLGVHNLPQAIRQVNPWAVDLSSSLETGGKKDPEKIRQAVEVIRREE